MMAVLTAIIFLTAKDGKTKTSKANIMSQDRTKKLLSVAIAQSSVNARNLYKRDLKAFGQPDVPNAMQAICRTTLKSRIVGNEPANVSQLASDKNQVMDELLNQPQIPSDYGETMMKLYRDRKQDVLTRDFAVQHIGLYAQALNRRGEYDAASAESQKFRLALFDAAGETRTIVAAAAFRALSDMSAFDSRIDAGRLDSLLARCAADPSAAPAARAMAVQLCGERRIASSRMALEEIAADESAPEILRRSARHSISLLDKGGSR